MAELLEFLERRGNTVARLELYPPDSPANALLRLADAEAREAGEEPLQLMEGLRYEYAFVGPGAENLRLEEEFGKGAVEPSSINGLAHCGGIATGLNTGRLALVARDEEGEIVGRAALEIRSRKVTYRYDYRRMLEDITEQCVALLMELRAPCGHASGARPRPDAGHATPALCLLAQPAWLAPISGCLAPHYYPPAPTLGAGRNRPRYAAWLQARCKNTAPACPRGKAGAAPGQPPAGEDHFLFARAHFAPPQRPNRGHARKPFRQICAANLFRFSEQNASQAGRDRQRCRCTAASGNCRAEKPARNGLVGRRVSQRF